jgi:hypothetical protein
MMGDMRRRNMRLEQVGMGAGAGKVDYTVLNPVHQEPVWLNVTFGTAFVVAVNEMFMICSGQGYPTGNEQDGQINLVHVFTAFLHELVFFLEFVCSLDFKHGLTVQILQELFYGHTLGGYLPVNHVLHFPYGGDGFGVRRVIHWARKPGIKLSLGEWAGAVNAGNGEDNLRSTGAESFRHVKVYMQPPVGGYGYGLL